MVKSTPRLLQVSGKAVPLHRVFHGIRFKVNERLVVVMTTFFFMYMPISQHFVVFASSRQLKFGCILGASLQRKPIF